MKRKLYTSIEVNLSLLEEEDIITASAGSYDSQQGNDVVGDDIFD